MKETIQFRIFLNTAFDGGLYTNDDLIAFVLPLFKETARAHDQGLVGPFGHAGSLGVKEGHVVFLSHSFLEPQIKELTVTDERNRISEGYIGFELSVGMHDMLTDIYCLG